MSRSVKTTISKLAKTSGVWSKNDLIPKKLFKEIELGTDDLGTITTEKENLDASTMGTTIDLATRYFILEYKNTFEQARKGADILNLLDTKDRANYSAELTLDTDYEMPLYGDSLFECVNSLQHKSLSKITRSDYDIIATMAYLEACYRSLVTLQYPIKELNSVDFKHMKIFMKRCKNFFQHFGNPSVIDYEVNSETLYGDGDYLSPNYLVDFKLYSRSPVYYPRNRRQIFMYYLLGREQHRYPEFQTVKKLIFFNPRNDMAYVASIEDIPTDLIEKTRKIMNIGFN